MNLLTRIRSAVIGIWIGSILFAGAVVAPTLFKDLGSRTKAGEVFGKVLQSLNKLEIVCALLLVGLRVLSIWKTKKRKDHLKQAYKPKLILSDGILILVFTIWFYYSQVITPEMNSLRSKITSFDTTVSELEKNPSRIEELEARKRFDVLHKRYSHLMKTNLILGVVIILVP